MSTSNHTKKDNAIPILSSKEVTVVQNPLGEGGFCSVSAIRKINIHVNRSNFMTVVDADTDVVASTTDKSSSTDNVTETDTDGNTTIDASPDGINTTTNTNTTTKLVISKEQTQVRKQFANQFKNYEKEYHSIHNIHIPTTPNPIVALSSHQAPKKSTTIIAAADPTIQKPPRVALKRVKKTNSKKRYKIGIQDLAAEVLVLSQCSHPNIITLHAVGYDDDDNDNSGTRRRSVENDHNHNNGDGTQNDTHKDNTQTTTSIPNQNCHNIVNYWDINSCFKSQRITFAVIDQLKSTLRDRLYKWKEDKSNIKIVASASKITFGLGLGFNTLRNIMGGGGSGGNKTENNIKRNPMHDLWLERLVVILKIADAIQYLHSKGIMHRDINADNIGFSYGDNTVKLFDFGLAKCVRRGKREKMEKTHVVVEVPATKGIEPGELGEEESKSTSLLMGKDKANNDGEVNRTIQLDDKIFNLSAETGTLRYMAPEVAMSLPYGLKVDIYSFALVIYEILSLRKAYLRVQPSNFRDKVIRDGLRPRLEEESWPDKICDLLKNMWSTNVSVRPNSKQVVDTLSDLLRGDDDDLYPSN